MISRLFARLFALSLWVMAFGALAQGTDLTLGVHGHDADSPINITSEELALDQQDGSAVFSGNVVISQGGITLTGDSVRVEYEEHPTTGKSGIKAIRMSGSVTFASGSEAVEADEAVYTLADGLLAMTGNLLLVQGLITISADRLDYDLTSGKGRVEGNVKTVLQRN